MAVVRLVLKYVDKNKSCSVILKPLSLNPDSELRTYLTKISFDNCPRLYSTSNTISLFFHGMLFSQISQKNLELCRVWIRENKIVNTVHNGTL